MFHAEVVLFAFGGGRVEGYVVEVAIEDDAFGVGVDGVEQEADGLEHLTL